MRVPLVAPFATVVLLAAQAGAAAYTTFLDSVPAPGATGVARDTAIILGLKAWTSVPGESTPLPTYPTVSVVDSSGAEVDFSRLAGDWPEGSAFMCSPEPLQANAQYTVRAEIANETEPPPDATGETTMEFSFTTGEEMSPHFTLEGELEARLEAGEAPVFECSDVCMGDSDCQETCVQVGIRPAWIAEVTVPVVRGAFDGIPNAYEGDAWVSADRPVTFTDGERDYINSVLAKTHFYTQSGNTTSLSMLLASTAEAFVPWVTVKLQDRLGDWLVARPIYLELVGPDPDHPAETGDAGAAGAESDDSSGRAGAGGLGSATARGGAAGALDDEGPRGGAGADGETETGVSGSSGQDADTGAGEGGGGGFGPEGGAGRFTRTGLPSASERRFAAGGCVCTQTGRSHAASWIAGYLLMAALCPARRRKARRA